MSETEVSTSELKTNGALVSTAGATPTAWSREQIDLIKNTVAKGTTDDEFALFLYVCRRTGLDPLAKQIYAIKRWNSQEKRQVMTIQTGIDGFRLTAARTNAHVGTDDAIFESLDANADYPSKASTTVYRMVQGIRAPYTASARWQEYRQLTSEGQIVSMWQKMPFLMLAKCSEALALRKAFPAELSGLYTHEEMMQAENPPIALDRVKTVRVPIPPTGDTLDMDAPGDAVEPVEEPAPTVRLITQPQIGLLISALKSFKVEEERFTKYIRDLGYESRKDIPMDRVDELLRWIKSQKQ